MTQIQAALPAGLSASAIRTARDTSGLHAPPKPGRPSAAGVGRC